VGRRQALNPDFRVREATMPQVPEDEPARLTDQIPSAYAKFAQVYQSRCATAMQTYLEATGQATDVWLNAVQPLAPTELWRDVTQYSSDFVQRSLLFWDTLGDGATIGSNMRRPGSLLSWPSTGRWWRTDACSSGR